MKAKNFNPIILLVVILAIALMLGGCSQPQKKPDPTPTVPPQTNTMNQADPSPTTPQPSMMGQNDPSTMMRDNPEAMQKAMTAPENRQTMIKMMSSPQMRPVLIDMMKDPTMANAMIDIMADPSMKDTFTAMVKDPRLAPIAREALKQ